MTDPTPTPQTPPQGLTEDTLREQWNAQADEFNQWDSLDSAEQFAWAQKRAIAADRAARVGLAPPQGLTDEQLDALERQHWEATGVVSEAMQAEELFNYRAFARAAIAAHEAARPTPTPEALQAAYSAWFKAEQGIPPSPAAARTAAAFASAVLRGEVQ